MFIQRRSLLAAAAIPGMSHAQAPWPANPVRFITPFAPGGGVDTLVRLYCSKLADVTGQSFVVENRAGAGGNIGTLAIARSPADGTVIGLGSVSSLAISPVLRPDIAFDVERDFTYIAGLWQLPNLLIVNNDVPAHTVPELIDLIRRNPGQYSFASPGSGTTVHLSGEMFKQMAGLDMLHVPYRGGAAAQLDVQAGRVHMIFDNIPQSLASARTGKVRALAVTSRERSPHAPEIPAMSESLPGFDITSWGSVVGPAGLATPIVERLSALTRAVLASPDFIARLADNGATAWPMSSEELIAFRRASEAKLAPVIRASGARIE
ncbi:tripartite tricarboxylate transporter substrate binding protein [Roseomonas terrae]|jgi:tripartite-type tricarboxylate transporter receptor subunit TctC|uniref:Tripartite tricarboxylate transporter substrate binding protein n=1 Tax=Neoroseomonas terrae TaxID=424799 RepID=A0ABS5EPH0_9PROT|nr:tripartite tricarboxylate transporter substrate binding protein [Neoroseomonas terrae]MBR0652939.1 tripartite tricarboxylate transporter substrate binding protein [Neoroseomonas terrae]